LRQRAPLQRRSRTELLRPIWRNVINRPHIPFAERHLHS